MHTHTTRPPQVLIGDDPVEVSNAVFDAWWQTSSYFHDELVRRKTMSTLLFAR